MTRRRKSYANPVPADEDSAQPASSTTEAQILEDLRGSVLWYSEDVSEPCDDWAETEAEWDSEIASDS
ncbi:MAG: hypothetical protein GEU28_03365 [Dehalococcoidia bacterium]|nr:hypothetical protein [Dehalococcoidia bacterium]